MCGYNRSCGVDAPHDLSPRRLQMRNFEWSMCQTGQCRDTATKQKTNFCAMLQKGCRTYTAGRTLFQHMSQNIVQFPALTKNTEEVAWNEAFWSKYEQSMRDVITFNAVGRAPGEVMRGYWDMEPPLADLDNDGVEDDRMLSTNFKPDLNIRTIASNAFSILRYNIHDLNLTPELAGWVWGKSPNGNPSPEQIDGVGRMNVTVGNDWLCIHGYPFKHPTDKGYTSYYLGEAYDNNIEAWRMHTDKPLIIAFQSRVDHKDPIEDVDSVYFAARSAATWADGLFFWNQAEMSPGSAVYMQKQAEGKGVFDYLAYWDSLNIKVTDAIAQGILEGLSMRG